MPLERALTIRLSKSSWPPRRAYLLIYHLYQLQLKQKSVDTAVCHEGAIHNEYHHIFLLTTWSNHFS